jgi:hypothetical protein
MPSWETSMALSPAAKEIRTCPSSRSSELVLPPLVCVVMSIMCWTPPVTLSMRTMTFAVDNSAPPMLPGLASVPLPAPSAST